ncbi:TonB-dependent receptor [Luteimonas sp. MC1825]|uniref:TonB-dependent receptor domain-containing protein n=1 Tax=Luteimonas sp. MC1825 TaxID=2761107 RepID=UPI00161B2E58|nr:TonB-dependent receptor [Luteimonas sp. MC1825]MBB6598612.1 TonB-dependent receptor [Luteimonas sp. MC1825]QOC88789.1 TonB-dependent receptor [Luteimonas sp. MC1825]
MQPQPFTRARPRLVPLVLALSAILSSPALYAATDAVGDPVDLDRVVVTATGFEQKLTEAPASISVITREELAARPYTTLVDALRDVEGIDVGMETTDKNGQGSISMRGLPSEYTLVLIDGRRQSNVGQLYPNNFGGGQFSFMPPLDAIDRIEVVRGPMSTLYGSDAMGGVINIITRRIGREWTGSFTQGFTLQQEDEFGDARTTDVYLSGPLVKDVLGLTVRGSWYDIDESMPEWDPLPLPDGSLWERTLGFGGGGKQVANTSWNSGIRLSLTANENHDLWLDYDIARQKHDNTRGQTGTLDGIDSLWRSGNATLADGSSRRVVQPRVGYTPYQRYERDQLALTHVGRWAFGTSQTSLTRHTTSNLGRSLPLTIAERGELQDLWNDVCARRAQAAYCNNGTGAAGIASSGLTAEERARLEAFLPRPLRVMELDGHVLDTRLDMGFGDHQVTVGGQYNDTDMEDGVFGMDGAGFRDGTTQTHRQWALFAEDNWALTDRLTATLGVRYDRHNMFGSQVSPRAYLVWAANARWTVKGGVSTGYKTPRPDQLFPGITGFGGQGVSPFVGSPDLQPETSRNYELAVYHDAGRYGFDATLFFNRFEDKIASGDNIPNCEVAPAGGGYCVDIGPGWAALGYNTFSQSINIASAETRGVELAGRVDLSERWLVRGNYTWTKSEQTSGDDRGNPIAGNPAEHMLNANLGWRATDALTLSLIGEGRYDRYRDTLLPGVTSVSERTVRHYDNYTVFHLGANWKATDALTFNARINNLTDKDFVSQSCLLATSQAEYTCVDDYAVKEKRRSLWLSVNYRF